MDCIKRNLTHKVDELLRDFPAVAILGARQCGKTTLAKTLKPDWHYIDLENITDLDRFQHDPNYFFEQHPDGLLIDEAQECPEVFKVLRGVIDKDRQKKGRFLLTGSSSPELLKKISESLAGRIALVELDTLKMNEYYRQPLSDFYQLFTQPLNKKNVIGGKALFDRRQIHHAWFYGGYPEPLLQNSDQFFSRWMDQYRKTYINRDLSLLFPKLNHQNYQRFLSMLGNLSGNVLNKNDLARALEVSEKTIRNYLNIAEGTYLWQAVNSFEQSSIKTVLKMPKGYLRDSGLLHHLIMLNQPEQLYNHPIVGKSFEGFVTNEIIKGLRAAEVVNWQPTYYRTKAGAEVDLILQGPFGTLPIEIKYGSHVKMRDLQHLSNFIEQEKLGFGIVINQCDKVSWLTEKIAEVPAGLL
jgi:uncharacterized protein